MKFSTVLSTVAAVTLAIAPIAAQAGTRAAVPSTVAASVASDLGNRSSQPVAEKNDLFSRKELLALLSLLGLSGLVIALSHGGKSRGTGTV